MKQNAKALVVLSISPDEDDHLLLEQTLVSTLYKTNSPSSVPALIRTHNVNVVICERDLSPGTWLEVLEELMLLPDAPPLIVTSRLADDALWIEALHRGAYDVLAKPFNHREVIRSVNLAFLHWYHRHDIAHRATKVIKAAS
jgi:DNA-binding NtrC family response regulator